LQIERQQTEWLLCLWQQPLLTSPTSPAAAAAAALKSSSVLCQLTVYTRMGFIFETLQLLARFVRELKLQANSVYCMSNKRVIPSTEVG